MKKGVFIVMIRSLKFDEEKLEEESYNEFYECYELDESNQKKLS